MNRKNVVLVLLVLGALLLGVMPSRVAADTVTNVTINTSSLGATPGSEIFFILTDGSGANDANNTATLTNFALGGGIAGSVDALNSSGGFSGDLTSSITLVDSSFVSILGQLFTAGNTLSFTLDLTSNVDAGGTPDQFAMVILDPNGNPLQNSDPLGFGNLLVINIDSASPTINNYAPDLLTLGSAPPPPPPPPPPTSTPEPSSLALLSSAVLGLAAFLGRRALTPRQP